MGIVLVFSFLKLIQGGLPSIDFSNLDSERVTRFDPEWGCRWDPVDGGTDLFFGGGLALQSRALFPI